MDDRFISRFWENYIAKLKAYGIKPNRVRWHVTHAAQSIQTFPDCRLATHMVQDVEQYLQEFKGPVSIQGIIGVSCYRSTHPLLSNSAFYPPALK